MNASVPRWARLCLFYGLGFLGGSVLMIGVLHAVAWLKG